ncbi:MAG: transcriptional repressor [Planctomycetota bacterium]
MDLDPNPLPTEPDLNRGDAVPAVIEPLCAVFRRRLKADNQKYTPERARVLDAVIRMDGLFDAEELQDELKSVGFRVSKATVYRTIKLMQDAGILQRVLAGDDQPRYQLVYGARPNDLIVRIDTDETVSIDVPELIAIRDRVCAELGLRASGHKLQIYATKA